MPVLRTRLVVGLAFLLTCGPPALALNPALDVDQYAHAAWTIRQGFLSSPVLSIAQTPDGYLWVGTESGLFRFDGVRTVPWQPRGRERLPHGAIARLLAARDGRLWIGTQDGLASWKDGRLITYPELSGHVVDALVEDSRGTVWIGTIGVPTGRLCAFRTTMQCAGQDGRLGNGVFSLLEDGGALWVGAGTGLWRWTPDAPTRFPLSRTAADLARIRSGPLVVATSDGLRRVAADTLERYQVEGLSAQPDARRLLVDRDGGLWIGTQRGGLIHVHQGRTDTFTSLQGLSGNGIGDIFEDRDGNIWVGTNEGLERFRELPVTSISKRQGLAADIALSVLAARDGSIWLGSGDGLTRWSNGEPTVYRIANGLPDNRVGTLFEDSAGSILAATLSGTARFADGRFRPLRSLASTRIVYNIVEDPSGDLWLTDQEQGLIRLRADEVVSRTPWSALGHVDHATAMVEDRRRGGLWLGFYKGGIAFVQDGRIRASYGAADGLGTGRVAELQVDADGTLWAATAGGLSRISGQTISTLTGDNGLPCDAVHWMVTGADGARWLMLACGLVRIAAADWQAWLVNPARSIENLVFTSADGVRTQWSPIGLTPAAALLPDGRLWFSTPNGIGEINPAHLALNTRPPPVQIEQIVADRATYDSAPGAAVRLPARTHDVQIDYTALSLGAPERVRFRYRLDGRDGQWQDVGTRRQAFYTDLRPGRYRFHVTAATSGGAWNPDDAVVDFTIAPAYYQTRWFLALSVATAVGLAWAVHFIRLRIVARHEREISALNERLMKAQEQERIRIAGELHDGVMQQMLAATLMLGTAKRRITNNPDAAATIDKVQDKLVQAGTEIRQLSHDLHPPLLQESGLPGAVRAYCEQFSAASGLAIDGDVEDSATDLSRGASLALFRIVQEALGNVAKHARAQHVTVRLRRAAEIVSVEIADDGVGFETGWMSTRASGGLGVVMMRERATQLNGTFELESAPARGTTITVRIPFR